jgi:signal transduction histidine kinase
LDFLMREVPAAIAEALEGVERISKIVAAMKDKGTGQGLAISHSVVVDRPGGTLDVESEVGVGTEFVIRLPLAQEEGSATVEQASRTVGPAA